MKNVKVIPGFSNYGITKDGQLFNLKTRKWLKFSRSLRGYYFTYLVNDDGERKSVKRHRAVALTHLEIPTDIENPVVNHKDLTPGNDYVDNLEWISQKENVLHWLNSGVNTKETIKLEVFDRLTGEIVRYNSIGECAKKLNIDRYSISHRLSQGCTYIWPEQKCYRKGHSSKPWVSRDKLVHRLHGRSRSVILKNLLTGNEICFKKMNDLILAYPEYNFKTSTLWVWANDKNQPVIPGFFMIQFINNKKPWRTFNDVLFELEKTIKGKFVIVFDSKMHVKKFFFRAIDCANHYILNATTLNYRLKFKASKDFNGNYFCYYDDLDEIQKKTIRYKVLQEAISEECVQRPSKATAQLNESNDSGVKSTGCENN